MVYVVVGWGAKVACGKLLAYNVGKEESSQMGGWVMVKMVGRPSRSWFVVVTDERRAPGPGASSESSDSALHTTSCLALLVNATTTLAVMMLGAGCSYVGTCFAQAPLTASLCASHQGLPQLR